MVQPLPLPTPMPIQLPTPVGVLEFVLEPAAIKAPPLSLRLAAFKPKLPQGMSVLASYAVLLKLQTLEPVVDLKFSARLIKPSSKGGASTGEGLEALEWEDEGHVMLIGTEDREYLERRLPKAIVLPDEPVTCSSGGLSVHVASIPAGVPVSLHFVVAWNRLPERVAQSCWFAVDQNHTHLWKATVGI